MTKTYVQTLYYKKGDTDSFAAVLRQNNVAIDLTVLPIHRFIMKNDIGTRHVLTCTLGATYQGSSVNGAAGGITVVVDSTSTAAEGEFDGEFEVGVSETNTERIPSGNNYYKIVILPSL